MLLVVNIQMTSEASSVRIQLQVVHCHHLKVACQPRWTLQLHSEHFSKAKTSDFKDFFLFASVMPVSEPTSWEKTSSLGVADKWNFFSHIYELAEKTSTNFKSIYSLYLQSQTWNPKVFIYGYRWHPTSANGSLWMRSRRIRLEVFWAHRRWGNLGQNQKDAQQHKHSRGSFRVTEAVRMSSLASGP